MTPTEARALAVTVAEEWDNEVVPKALRSLADQVEALQRFHSVVRKDKATEQMETLQWQPIETAPHNQRVFVYYTYTNGLGRRIIATYYDEETLNSAHEESEFAEPGWYEESYASDEIYPVEVEPTHWMPLPTAPLDRARGQHDPEHKGLLCAVVASETACRQR